MDSTIRTTSGLISRIEKLRDDLIKRFENLIGSVAIEKTDRNTTAVLQFQMQVETTALIRAAEELQTLIRTLQEMWLFGQLDTIGDNKVQQQTDETAKEVAQLLKQIAAQKSNGQSASIAMDTGV